MRVIGLGDIVFWARIHAETGIYEVCELRVRTIYPDCFVGVDKNSRVAHLINYDECGVTVFDDRRSAVAIVKEAEKKKKEFTVDKDDDS